MKFSGSKGNGLKGMAKNVLALCLAAVMCMAMGGFGTTAMADDMNGDRGSITVSGLESGVTVSAYQIAAADYDSNGNFTGYSMTVQTNEGGFKINSDGSYDKDTLTEASLAELWENVSETNESLEERYKGQAIANTDGTATIENLPVGSYLLVVTGSESTAYAMMIGSVSYETDETTGEWKVTGGSVDVAGSNAWVKSTTPTITKTENNGKHGDSANVGDEVSYTIQIDNIPSYQGDYPEFHVDDALTGLHLTDEEIEDITVRVGDTTLTEGEDYTVTPSRENTGFTIDFVVNGSYTLNEYAGSSMTIEYSATVDSTGEAVADHENDATVTFATTSYTVGNDGNPETGTDEDKDHDYSFTAAFLKVGSDNTDKGLSGATFALYTDDACKDPYVQGGTAVTATSGEDGTFTFSGLAEGTYYMKETKAPVGYVLSEEVYTIWISANYGDDGSLADYAVRVIDSGGSTVGTASGETTVGIRSVGTITNTKSGLLPSMGGRGTLILIICAAAVCAAGAGMYARNKRKAAA